MVTELKNINGIALNKGHLQADGLFNLTLTHGDVLLVSYWFNEQTKNELMQMPSKIFIETAKDIIGNG